MSDNVITFLVGGFHTTVFSEYCLNNKTVSKMPYEVYYTESIGTKAPWKSAVNYKTVPKMPYEVYYTESIGTKAPWKSAVNYKTVSKCLMIRGSIGTKPQSV